MIRKYVLSILALAGFLLALWTVMAGSKPIPAAPPVAAPAKSPFDRQVAGAGMIEASTRNIEIGAPAPGLVMEVFIEAGDAVKVDQPLFKLDDRELAAELMVREAALAASKAQLEKLLSYPRPEDVPPAEAKVQAASETLDDLKAQLALWESIADPRAVVKEEFDRRRFAVRIAEARLIEEQATLSLLKAGSWKPDIDIARADVAAREAEVRQTQIQLDRLTVRSPIDGQVLQLNIRKGEYASSGALPMPLVIVGNIDDLHIRVDVDENDALRVKSDAKAVAFVRGDSRMKVDLQFVRFEPFVVPKKSLTGASTERVDTRVLQVLYKFKRSDLPVYVGQLMDVSIDAEPTSDGAPIASQAPAGAASRPKL